MTLENEGELESRSLAQIWEIPKKFDQESKSLSRLRLSTYQTNKQTVRSQTKATESFVYTPTPPLRLVSVVLN
jgi:hypothetical protein